MDVSEREYLSTGRGSSGNAQAQAVDAPLTVEITDRADTNIGVAQEIRSRLYTLRDRLFGPPPPEPASTLAVSPKGEPGFHCFDSAARAKGRALRAVLDDIDALTSFIETRL